MPAFFTPEQAILLATTPYAFWIASLVSSASLKAARQTPVPPKPEVADPKPVNKLKTAVSVGGFILLQLAIFFGIQIALNRLSATVMDTFLNGMVSFAFVTWTGPVLFDLLGQIDTSFARYHDGPLVAHYKLSWRQTLVLALSVVGCAYFLPRMDSVGHFVIVALASVTIPVALARVPIQKTASLRRLLAFFVGIPIAVIVFCAILGVILASGLISDNAFDSLGQLIAGDEETRTKPEKHDFRSLRGFYLFQVLMLCGISGSFITMLHRADEHLASLKTRSALALADDAPDEHRVTLLEPLPSLKIYGNDKGPSGARVPIPSAHMLVKHNFVAAHRNSLRTISYAKVAGLAAIVAIGPLASSLRFLIGAQGLQMQDVDVSDLFSEMIAIYLFPWLAIIAISALAVARGESREIWDYREDWTSSGPTDAGFNDEKAALFQT